MSGLNKLQYTSIQQDTFQKVKKQTIAKYSYWYELGKMLSEQTNLKGYTLYDYIYI